MRSETTERKLPTIDFSNPNLKPGTQEWEETKTRIYEALEMYGCFEALFDKMPSEVRKSLFDSLRELFDLPLETKMRNVSKKPFHGYVGQHPHVPLYESMGIDDVNIEEEVEKVTKALWPQGNPNFSDTMVTYSKKLSEVDQTIRRMIIESLNLEKHLDEHMDSTNYLLRVMKYKGPQTTNTKLGLSAHADKNVVTILCQNEVDGLEIQNKKGEWITFKPSTPNSFIAMIGDSLYAWVNGRLHSPYHKVMMSGNEARYSVGLFSVPKAGYIIKAPEEMVDEDHPLLFKPFDHVQFLGFVYSEAGQKSLTPLKDYCGLSFN